MNTIPSPTYQNPTHLNWKSIFKHPMLWSVYTIIPIVCCLLFGWLAQIHGNALPFSLLSNLGSGAFVALISTAGLLLFGLAAWFLIKLLKDIPYLQAMRQVFPVFLPSGLWMIPVLFPETLYMVEWIFPLVMSLGLLATVFSRNSLYALALVLGAGVMIGITFNGYPPFTNPLLHTSINQSIIVIAGSILACFFLWALVLWMQQHDKKDRRRAIFYSAIPFSIFLFLPLYWTGSILLQKFILVLLPTLFLVFQWLTMPGLTAKLVQGIQNHWVYGSVAIGYGVSLAFFLWYLPNGTHLETFITDMAKVPNEVKQSLWESVMHYSFIPPLLLLVVYGVLGFFKRAVVLAQSIVLLFLPMFGLILVPILLIAHIEYEYPLLTIFILLILVTLSIWYLFFFYRHFGSRILNWIRSRRWLPNLPSLDTTKLPWILILLLTLGYVLYFIDFTLLRYWSGYAYPLDLSWENQAFWTAAFKGFFHSTVGWYDGNYLQSHAPFIYYLFSPIYYLFPVPETTLIIQTVVIGMGAIPLFLIVIERIQHRWIAFAVAVTYLLYPAIHGMTTFDIHSSPFCMPFVFAAFYFIYKQKWVLVTIFLLLVAACREDCFLLVIAISFFLVLSRRNIHFGVLTTLTFVVGYFFLTNTVMTYYGGGPNLDRFNVFFKDPTMTDFVKTLVLNPFYIITYLFSEQRILYVVFMFLPLVFLSFYNKKSYLFLLIPGFILTIFSWNPPHYTVGYQYSAPLVPIIFILGVEGIRRLLDRMHHSPARKNTLSQFKIGLVIFLLVQAVLMNYLYGNIFSKTYKWTYINSNPAPYKYNGWIGCYTTLPKVEPKDVAIHTYAYSLPSSAVVSTSNDINAYFSSRQYCYIYPQGENCADYVVLAKSERKDVQHMKQNENFTVVHEDQWYLSFQWVDAAQRLIPKSDDLSRLQGIQNGDFETGTLQGWAAKGLAFECQPTYLDNTRFRNLYAAIQGDFWVGSYEANQIEGRYMPGRTQTDSLKGTLTSDPFLIQLPQISFLMSGGSSPKMHVDLIVEGQIAHSATNLTNDEILKPVRWDVSPYLGQQAVIQILDQESGYWGHINADDFQLSNP